MTGGTSSTNGRLVNSVAHLLCSGAAARPIGVCTVSDARATPLLPAHRWRIVDYVWWAINVMELVTRAISHRRRFWVTQHVGGWSFHIRNIVSIAVLAGAALFSLAVRLDGFFFIIGSLRLPLVRSQPL